MMMVETRSIDLPDGDTMMMEVVPSHTALPPHHMIFGDTSSGGEDPEPEPRAAAAAPATKKRAETWAAEETRALIALRREVDSLFNTSKSNKHLWEQISAKMRDKGFDRSPTMCTDKWRNLLKEFKKARHKGNGKVSFYKEIEELIRERNRNNGGCATASPSGAYQGAAPQVVAHKVDAFIQFSDKGFDDAAIQFGPMEANGRSANLERRLDHDGDPLTITNADAVATGGVPPWNWRDATGNGEDPSAYGGRVISVKLGEYTRKVGIDGSADAIKEAIKSAFRLRTKRAFWLEDENQVVRSIDREMPSGNYILHLDEGITIKVCLCVESGPMPVHSEEKTFYTQDDFRDFLSRRGWIGLREVNRYRSIDTIEDLHSGAIYEGVRLLGD